MVDPNLLQYAVPSYLCCCAELPEEAQLRAAELTHQVLQHKQQSTAAQIGE
jgi:hypothetical protein